MEAKFKTPRMFVSMFAALRQIHAHSVDYFHIFCSVLGESLLNYVEWNC